ncbi:unnamed protein product [Pseudo-nitzschia multistriata]|uniref:SCP domain-containing protein n=1 Tax=Pseudo-nitzschia multistriata TaxID=183589 RepID=A0A448ZC32_9STRA|nr:unnamed protein product [Pseudo-nitzschia multistriata]
MPKRSCLLVATVFLRAWGTVRCANDDNDNDNAHLCARATANLVSLDDVIDEYEASLESNTDGDTWTFGFPDPAFEAYEKACGRIEGDSSIWLQALDTAAFECDLPALGVEGRAVEFYGIGKCLAKTAACESTDPLDLVETVWKNAGMECRTPGESSRGGGSGSDEEHENGGDGGNSETISPGEEDQDSNGSNNNDSNDNKGQGFLGPDDGNDAQKSGSGPSITQMPFLTDDDIACLNATASFYKSRPGLQSAQATYDHSSVHEDRNDDLGGAMVIGYPGDNVAAMKAACQIGRGHWTEGPPLANLTCVVHGTETAALEVFNYGVCLAKVEECLSVDPVHFLQKDLAEGDGGMACWPDDDQTDGGGEGNDDNDDDNKDGGASAEGGGNSDYGPELSDDDRLCMEDTESMNQKFPELQGAGIAYAESMDSDMTDVEHMMIGFTEEAVDAFDKVCTKSQIDGHFALIAEEDFACDAMGVSGELFLLNLAGCLANTVECRAMDPLVLTESVFKSMGLKCRAKTDAEKEQGNDNDKQQELNDNADNDNADNDNADNDSTDNDNADNDNAGNDSAGNDSTDNDSTDNDNADNDSTGNDNTGNSGTDNNDTNSDTDDKNNKDSENETDNDEDTGSNKDSGNKDGGNGNSNASSSSRPGNPDDESLAKALGLDKSDLACMANSTGFIDRSETLQGAEKEYQAMAQLSPSIHQPKKVGYPAEASEEMERVCKAEGGAWFIVPRGDVTCESKGCIHVYNFGNCVADTDSCAYMDPMVLVRVFFKEVLGLNCQAGCDDQEHNDVYNKNYDQKPSGTAKPPAASPKPQTRAPHATPSGSGNLFHGASQAQTQAQTSASGTSMITAAFAVCAVLGLIGFGAVYHKKWSGRSGRQQLRQGDIEMMGNDNEHDLWFRPIS